MAKNIVAVIEEYQKQDGTQGAKFCEIGVVNVSQNGKEYALLDPTINLAGVLMKQNEMATAKGEPARKMVMCSVREREQQGQSNQGGYGNPSHNSPNQQGGYSNQPPQGQGGYQNQGGYPQK